MNSDEVVQKHFDLCVEVHSVLIEENRILKSSASVPSEEFLQKKEKLLPMLDQSLEGLKSVQVELFCLENRQMERMWMWPVRLKMRTRFPQLRIAQDQLARLLTPNAA